MSPKSLQRTKQSVFALHKRVDLGNTATRESVVPLDTEKTATAHLLVNCEFI